MLFILTLEIKEYYQLQNELFKGLKKITIEEEVINNYRK